MYMYIMELYMCTYIYIVYIIHMYMHVYSIYKTNTPFYQPDTHTHLSIGAHYSISSCHVTPGVLPQHHSARLTRVETQQEAAPSSIRSLRLGQVVFSTVTE